MEISSSTLKLRLAMVRIEELKPHEQVVEALVDRLAEEMREEAIVRDPLMVDQTDLVILDGMHRFDALKRLKARFAPCCLLDYMDPRITVGSWFRAFRVEGAESVAQEILSSMQLDYSVQRMSAAEFAADPGTILITRDARAFSLPDPTEIIGQCRIATNIEKQMVQRGHEVAYLSESSAMQCLKSERADLVIVLPAFTKNAIRKFGSQGILLPHKVTRHVIPSRPMEIDVPLSVLTDPNISNREADQKLNELLERRRIERKPPGTVVNGRRYDEELIVFS